MLYKWIHGQFYENCSSVPYLLFQKWMRIHWTVSGKLTRILRVSVKLPKSWNCKMLITNAIFKIKNKKSCTCWWNFPAFGIEKNGPTCADFEACPKFVFSSFKTQFFLAFLKNWQTFLGQFFFFWHTSFFFHQK